MHRLDLLRALLRGMDATVLGATGDVEVGTPAAGSGPGTAR